MATCSSLSLFSGHKMRGGVAATIMPGSPSRLLTTFWHRGSDAGLRWRKNSWPNSNGSLVFESVADFYIVNQAVQARSQSADSTVAPRQLIWSCQPDF